MMPRPQRKHLAALMFVLACACQLAATFDVRQIPAEDGRAYGFLAQADSDPAPELFVLSKYALTIVFDPQTDEVATCSLAPGTAAVDVADTDGDGIAELYSVVGDEVRVRELRAGAQLGEPVVLFVRASSYAHALGYARPQVLVTTWEDQPVLAFPDATGMSLLTLDGTEVTRFDSEAGTSTAAMGARFATTPMAGPEDALEFNLSATFHTPAPSMRPILSIDIPPRARRATPMQAREAARMAPEDWPWFLLAPVKGPDHRVAYALGEGLRADTRIRFRRNETRDLPTVEHRFFYSPQRRYPGTLVIPPGEAPDFNGDGYADLLMWSSPLPGSSSSALLRALQSRTWPVRVMTHAYSRVREIYEGKPSARIDLRVPIEWCLLPESGMPLRHLSLNDFNGDGLTDISLATDGSRYGLWLSRLNGGFSSEPDYAAELPEEIQDVVLVAGAAADRDAMILLRAGTDLHLLTLPR